MQCNKRGGVIKVKKRILIFSINHELTVNKDASWLALES